MKMPVILLVDDDPSVVSALRRTLVREGYELLSALDGESALTILQNRDVNLILADQSMPGMSGLDLLDHVRVHHPGVLTMMLTANSNIDVALYAMNNVGVYKFILKPWNPEHLRRLIHKALKRTALPSEHVAEGQCTRPRADILRKWEEACPGISEVERDASGNYLLEDTGPSGM